MFTLVAIVANTTIDKDFKKSKELICRAYAVRTFTDNKVLFTFRKQDEKYFVYDISKKGNIITNKAKPVYKYKYSGINKAGYNSYIIKDKSYINIGNKKITDVISYKFLLALPESNMVFIGKCVIE
jgi:hypothetical protein